jgi:type IV secretory pathway VirJ component
MSVRFAGKTTWMHNLISAAVMLVFSLFAAAPAAAFDGGRYGDVKLALPQNVPRGYVVLFSDSGGWTNADEAMLQAVARAGSIAVGVDTDGYLDRAERLDPRCLQLLGDAESLSRQLQREYPGTEYYFPILAGIGRGGALAGAILAQAPGATIKGGVAVDPWSSVGVTREFCSRVLTRDDAGEPQIFGVPILKSFWSVALSPSASAESRSHFITLAGLVPQLELHLLKANFDVDTIASLIAPHIAPDDFTAISGLPIIELPAEPRTRTMAVFLSGDGGWRDIDKTIGENLQAMGVSLVGWDSLRYFWRKKSPEETATDLAAIIRSYGLKWRADKVALIGFSFGADVLPFIYNRLPPSLQERVEMITLLSSSRAADWEIRVAGWLGAAPSSEATPIDPAIRQIPGRKIQCFYGDEDKNSNCESLRFSGAEVIEKKGLHHFDGDYGLIAHQILDGLNLRISRGS